MSTTGSLATLSLPSGVTVVTTRRTRFATLERTIVAVNAVSLNLAIDALTPTTARLLSIGGPASSLTATLGSSGNLVGVYRYTYTYAIISSGVILTESPMATLSDPITAASNQVNLSAITTSSTSGVNARIVYRTTNGGVDLFKLTTLNNNTATTFIDNLSDYDLALLPASEETGNPPGSDGTNYLRLIVAWKDRLFAAENNDPDTVWFSSNRKPYAWPGTFEVKPSGENQFGVTAFMPRRDELVIAKRRRLWKLIGDSPFEWEQIIIDEGIGAVSQEASIVIRDACYFLGEEGFYVYGGQSNNLVCLSREKVHPWFTTDEFFNRSLFAEAFAKWNPRYDKLELHLAAAGSSDIDRWVELDLKTHEWYGPHKTARFTPSMGGAVDDANGYLQPVIGSEDGVLFLQNQTTAADDGVAIEMDIQPKFHNANTPDIEKYWGQPAVLSKIESTGSLLVIPKVGGLNASAQATISIDLTNGRARLRRLGHGRMAQLRFYENTLNQAVTIYGYEIENFELGRR